MISTRRFYIRSGDPLPAWLLEKIGGEYITPPIWFYEFWSHCITFDAAHERDLIVYLQMLPDVLGWQGWEEVHPARVWVHIPVQPMEGQTKIGDPILVEGWEDMPTGNEQEIYWIVASRTAKALGYNDFSAGDCWTMGERPADLRTSQESA